MGGVAAVAPADIVTSFTTGRQDTGSSGPARRPRRDDRQSCCGIRAAPESIVDKLINGVSEARLPWGNGRNRLHPRHPALLRSRRGAAGASSSSWWPASSTCPDEGGHPGAGRPFHPARLRPAPRSLVAIDALGADMGTVLIFGLVVAVPTLVIAGSAARALRRSVGSQARRCSGAGGSGPVDSEPGQPITKRPGFGPAVISITLPVLLMLLRRRRDHPRGRQWSAHLPEFLGTPAVALLLAVLVSMWFSGSASAGAGGDREDHRRLAAAHRRDPAHRGRRRWFQADARRCRCGPGDR